MPPELPTRREHNVTYWAHANVVDVSCRNASCYSTTVVGKANVPDAPGHGHGHTKLIRSTKATSLITRQSPAHREEEHVSRVCE